MTASASFIVLHGLQDRLRSGPTALAMSTLLVACGGGSSDPAPTKATLGVAAGALRGDTTFELTPLGSPDVVPSGYEALAGTAYRIVWTGAGFNDGHGVTLHIVDPHASPAGASRAHALGTRRWTREWGSSQTDIGSSIATDAGGNVYVAGTTNGILYGSTSRPPSPFLTQLDAAGTTHWGVQWAVGALYDGPSQVTLDATGNAYVVGTATSSGAVKLFVSKFDASGVAQGTYLHGGESSAVQVEGLALAIGSNGQGYVGGDVNGGPFDGNSNAGALDAYVHMFVLP